MTARPEPMRAPNDRRWSGRGMPRGHAVVPLPPADDRTRRSGGRERGDVALEMVLLARSSSLIFV
jgi:hypothetical protein